jgi:hypothetical protein
MRRTYADLLLYCFYIKTISCILALYTLVFVYESTEDDLQDLSSIGQCMIRFHSQLDQKN